MPGSDDRPTPGALRGSPAGFGLADVVDVVRRRWLAVAAAVVALLGVSWWQLHRDVPHYTAQVLLQRHRVDVLMIGGAPTLGARQVLASELEILRSRSVLSPVVDSLGLRLALEDAKTGRTTLLTSVRIQPDAPSDSYVLAPRGDSVTLRTPAGAPLATAPRGGSLAGPGFQIRPEPGLPERAIRFVILNGDEAMRQLRAALGVGQIEGTNLIRVRYTGTDPLLAAAVVNELAAAYQRHSANQDRADGARRREFIAEQLAALADSMATAQAALLDYQRQSRSLDPRLEGQAIAAALLETQNNVRGLRFQESLLTAVLLSLRSGGTNSDAFRRLVALGSDVLPGAEGLYGRLQTLETERQRLTASRYGYTDQGPQVQVLDSLIAATKEEARGITEESINLLRTRRAATETRQRELQQRVGELPEQAMTFARLQQRVDAVQRIVDLLVEKFYEALIPEAGGTGGVEVVDAATAPAGSDPLPGRSRLLFGLVVGLALGVGLAFGLEYADTTVRYPWDVEAAVQLPIVGIVPVLKSPLPLAVEGSSPEAEPFRMVRTTLRFVRAERPQIIAVTSPGPGEGKSLIAANLALAIQQQASRVLLIDADLRHPVLHRTLQLPREPGLSDVLVGEADLGSAIKSLGDPGLSVLTGGTTAPNPAELLGSDAFTKLLAQLRERFDTVIIDTPPVLSVADAAAIAPVVDGVLVVACVNQTHRLALAHAVEQLAMVKGSVLGVLLNRAPPTGAYRRYSYPYGAYARPEDTRMGQLKRFLRGGRRSG